MQKYIRIILPLLLFIPLHVHADIIRLDSTYATGFVTSPSTSTTRGNQYSNYFGLVTLTPGGVVRNSSGCTWGGKTMMMLASSTDPVEATNAPLYIFYYGSSTNPLPSGTQTVSCTTSNTFEMNVFIFSGVDQSGNGVCTSDCTQQPAVNSLSPYQNSTNPFQNLYGLPLDARRSSYSTSTMNGPTPAVAIGTSYTATGTVTSAGMVGMATLDYSGTLPTVGPNTFRWGIADYPIFYNPQDQSGGLATTYASTRAPYLKASGAGNIFIVSFALRPAQNKYFPDFSVLTDWLWNML